MSKHTYIPFPIDAIADLIHLCFENRIFSTFINNNHKDFNKKHHGHSTTNQTFTLTDGYKDV